MSVKENVYNKASQMLTTKLMVMNQRTFMFIDQMAAGFTFRDLGKIFKFGSINQNSCTLK